MNQGIVGAGRDLKGHLPWGSGGHMRLQHKSVQGGFKHPAYEGAGANHYLKHICTA